MSKERKWSLLVIIIGILLFVTYGEYMNWKEEKVFNQMDLGEGVRAELDEINEYIQSEENQFEPPKEMSEKEAITLNGKAFEEAPGDERIAVPEELKQAPEFEKVFNVGTFYRIVETITMTREKLLQEWVRYYFSNPEDEQILQKELAIHVKGFWKLDNEIFLQLNLEDPYGEEAIRTVEDYDTLPASFIGYTLQGESFYSGNGFDNSVIARQKDGTWEWILSGTIGKEKLPIYDRYSYPEDTQSTITFFIENSLIRTGVASGEPISSPIPINIWPRFAGEEYVINQRLRMSPSHEIEFVKLINYSDHSAVEIILHTEQEDDTLLIFQDLYEVIKSSVGFNIYYGAIIHMKEKNRYLVINKPIDEVAEEYTIDNLSIVVRNQNNFIVDLSAINQGQRLLSYLGWDIYVDNFEPANIELPPQLTLRLLHQENHQKMKLNPSEGYHLDHYYEIVGSYLGSTNTDVQISFSKDFNQVLPAVGEEYVKLNFRKFNGVRTSTPEFRDLLQSDQLDYSLFRYELKLPEFFIKYESEVPLSFPLTKTGKYFEPR